jgi:hypothetical protein
MTSEWDDGWPDWSDGGRRVEIQLNDGTVLAGTLRTDDVGFDGEDEYPIHVVVADDGTRHSFAGAKHWRFCESTR